MMINRALIDNVFKLAASKKPVAIDSVPEAFRESLYEFIQGRTLLKYGSSWLVPFSDYVEWLNELYYGEKVNHELTR